MPAGCEFICENKECKCHKTGFIVSGPWALGRVELVIENPVVKKMEDFRNDLIKRKKEGVKYVCIPYPNDINVPVDGYRIQKWCPQCKCIWNYDVMLSDTIKTVEDVLEKGDVPVSCLKCSSKLQSFQEVLDEGINCPHCTQPLQQNRWFTKEEA